MGEIQLETTVAQRNFENLVQSRSLQLLLLEKIDDVIAEFDNLKYIVYVQAKWHVGTTSEWSVYQIDGYKNQMCECDSAYTYATWVISSADGYSPVAVAEAEKRGVRFIDGKEFAQMLLNIGLLDLNDAFN